jgi:hypothetical protein
MAGVLIKEDLDIRNKIFNLRKIVEEGIETGTLESATPEITYKHLFTKKHSSHKVGMYAREMTALEGALIVGYIHKEEHITFLNKGKLKVLSETRGPEVLEAPVSFISPVGTRRVMLCLEDCVMTCVYLSSDPELDKENLTDEFQEELTPYEESLFTEDYKEVGLCSPSTYRSQGVLEWLE